MIPVEIQKKLNEIAKKYAPRFVKEVRDTLSKKKFTSSGRLANSVKAKISPATATDSPTIVISFEDYGEYIGSRKLLFTKQPPIDPEWVGRTNLRNFRVPGYKQGAQPSLSQEQIRKRIAFAISVSKKKDQKHKRKKWKREALPTPLKAMNVEIIRDAWANETANLLAQALTTKAA